MQPVELRQGHLTLIRAALRYWREENGTEAEELLQAYSGASDDNLPTADQVKWLMDHIESMELRYVSIPPSALHLSPEAAAQATTEQLASISGVLVFPTRLP